MGSSHTYHKTKTRDRMEPRPTSDTNITTEIGFPYCFGCLSLLLDCVGYVDRDPILLIMHMLSDSVACSVVFCIGPRSGRCPRTKTCT
jgi:hypothetical protein